MGAGVPMKIRKTMVYRKLKNIQRRLAKAGVESLYKHYQLCLFDTHNVGGGFNISYHWSFASNGESAATPVITIQPPIALGERCERWGGWCNDTKSLGSFDKGIARLIELFAHPAT